MSDFNGLGITKIAVAAMGAMACCAGAEAATKPDPLSEEQINNRIRQHRTAELTLTVADESGKPLANAQVVIRQVRHKFLFGCNAFRLLTEEPDLRQAYRDRFAELLN